MKRLLSTLGVFACCLLARSAPAQVLYAAIGDDSGSGLYTVNPLTSVSTFVGPITAGETQLSVTGLAIHPVTGVMYGVTADLEVSPQLITIDPATGNATVIGDVSDGAVPDITFSADGILYGWEKGLPAAIRASPTSSKASGRRSLAPPSQGVLLRIDLSTGAGTPVGSAQTVPSQAGCGISSVLGIIYLSLDRANGALRTVDPVTGATTAGPTMNGSGNAIAALATSPSGVLFGATNEGQLMTINTSTGAVTLIGDGDLPEGTDALVFTNSALGGGNALLNVPALGHAGLLALGAALALAGFFLVRLR
jgi:hypothetical protein